MKCAKVDRNKAGWTFISGINTALKKKQICVCLLIYGESDWNQKQRTGPLSVFSSIILKDTLQWRTSKHADQRDNKGGEGGSHTQGTQVGDLIFCFVDL